MSTGAQVAVLEPRGVRRPRARATARPTERPLVRLGAFAALALYGVLRWGTLLTPAPTSRLLGLLGLALLVAGPGRALAARSRPWTILAAVVALAAMFALAGVPLAWLRHVRIAVGADAIGQGLSSLPGVLVPYTGINEWVRMVTVLGAGVLLLDAALMLAFAPRTLSEMRRASAALPLVALAVVPSTLVHPHLPYLHGLILFALLAAFIWGERVSRYEVPLAVSVAVLAGAAAMVAAPAIDQHSPWLDYQALAGGLSPGHIEAFDWSQRYGPLNFPRTGREVLDVKASRGDYWKAEDLDLFTGIGWSQGEQPASPEPQLDPATRARWTQTIQVTLRAMRTIDVIAAGEASAPAHLAEAVVPGQGVGTWIAGANLQPGDTYRVTTYSPTPTPAELAAAGPEPSGQVLAGYRSILLPPSRTTLASPEIIFPPFHSDLQVTSVIGIYGADGNDVVRSSPYGRAFALARRLLARSATPAAFVAAVQNYLQHGYTYNENPPPSRYPLETFLFTDKIGYCQQFAGAMALLLRMGGIPARVAAGFTTGRYNSATQQWVVSDLDAHAWVEAWFPRYGWVRFDPTPAAAPARGGHALLPALHGATKAAAATPHPVKKKEPLPAASQIPSTTHSGGAPVALIVGAGVVVLAMLGLVLRVIVRPAQASGDELLAELERALARCGRPISDGLTLAALEHRFRSAPNAAEYIHRLRLVRFGGASELPTRDQRRALRGQLRAGLGAVGRLRALWALPPWTRPRRRSSITSIRGIQSR